MAVRDRTTVALATLCCLLAFPQAGAAEPVGGEGEGGDMYQPWIPDGNEGAAGGGKTRTRPRASGPGGEAGGWTDFGRTAIAAGGSGVRAGAADATSRSNSRERGAADSESRGDVAAGSPATAGGGGSSGPGGGATPLLVLAAVLIAAAWLVRPVPRT